MADLEQKRRTVRVLELLDKSFQAHARGDLVACDAAVNEAIECDAAAVSVIRGGMVIGEIPRPEEHWPEWRDYVAASQEGLRRMEEESGEQ